ncbi:MAG: tRNA lysidine(34) synthetase TilS [Desulfovibrio sp.]|jgi:tRNA(Ile)-lysidine synthase|nr:tRNA lysidine(34) synthetase TilS [Desulfovibrio sp.]
MPGDIPDLPADLRDLPAREAHFCLNILRFMENDLGLRLRGKRLLVAFSGGADSTALLLVLLCLRRKAGFTLLAAHLDHMLRPSSAAEAEYCRRFCACAGIACRVGRRNVRGGEDGAGDSGELEEKAGVVGGSAEKAGSAGGPAAGLEEKARAARYAFLAETAADGGADLVALGHNNNDLAEDVLMRLIRGAGWPGLAGMRALVALHDVAGQTGRPEPARLRALPRATAVTAAGTDRPGLEGGGVPDAGRLLVRPLLYTPRADIEDFLKASGIEALRDESNSDRRFFRNRVRMDILPLPAAENPAFLRAIRALNMQGEADREHFAALTAAAARGVLPQGSSNSSNSSDSPDSSDSSDSLDSSDSSDQSGSDTDGVFIERRRLDALPKAVRLRLYKHILDGLGPGQARFFSLAALDAPLPSGRGPSTHRFPGGKSAVVGHKGILFRKAARVPE